MEKKIHKKEKLHTLSEFRREVGRPLILAKKLVVWGEVGAVKFADGTARITEEETLKIKNLLANRWTRARYFLRALGPGLITGASDDDPSGLGTYSSVGAAFGLAILWLAAWAFVVVLAIQEICARIGIVTNKGLAGVLQKHYRRKIVAGIVVLLIVANVVNIGGVLGAMAASLELLSGIHYYILAFFFAILIIFVEIFFKYRSYAKILKWLTISVFAYIIAGFLVKPDWLEVLRFSFVPKISFSSNYIFAMVAVFGTTITPYLFFWQASEAGEEEKIVKLEARETPNDPEKNYNLHDRVRHMRTDVGTGMILANVVFFFIIVTTAQVFFKNGITDIGSAEWAALALKPLAGNYAYLLFALGIIGTGLLAVPILAGSGAYALSEVMKWREGLELKFSRARGFYLIIAISILV